MAKKIVETPLMKQYMEMKKKHPDALLLFRVGDFYETFSEDAIAASSILGITLTRRANGAASHVELAGFPHHALDTYLPKLIRAGRRVAICEQLEDPKLAKKLVKRGITELITPGVNTNDTLLTNGENNFLGGVHFGPERVGIAFLDLSTGEFLCSSGSREYADKLITSIQPKEMLRLNGKRREYEESIHYSCPVFELDDWVYTEESGRDRLQRQFGTTNLKGFGIEEDKEAVIAAGSLLHYLDITQHTQTKHITQLGRIDEGTAMRLDRFTVNNLELLHAMTPDGKSLCDVLDLTRSPMGSRELKRWILFPLLDVERINRRLDAVEHFFKSPELREELGELIAGMGDMERMVGKASVRRLGPRGLLQLGEAIRNCCAVRKLLKSSGNEELESLGASMLDCLGTAQEIRRVIDPNAPVMLSKGNVIRDGVDPELDELRSLLHNSRQALYDMTQREIRNTGITSLRISYNNVFGYYIEVRNTHKDKVPSDWIRKQTLVNAERYVTPELKEYESKILGAEERISAIESKHFNALLDKLSEEAAHIQTNHRAVAVCDCYLSFADAATRYRYVRPVVDDSEVLSVTEGRHPVIERQLPPGEPYVSNSMQLDTEQKQIMMITGPNMSGKSAFLRQTALIALMAQTGSFVPADAARIGIVDKIFTRVGASDNLSRGESTFMVEMTEAAAIINNLSQRSLVLFDELGRGTSTYDGISIAWSVVEHIHENGRVRPRTLFATHYHELNEMEKSYSRVRNYNVSVEESGGKVVFLRKLQPGGSEHSFGIHVAKLAGMPPSLVKRAGEVLKQLESSAGGGKPDLKNVGEAREGVQLSIFQLDDPLLSQIRDKLLTLNIDNLTPLQALNSLHELKSLLTGKES